MAQIGVVQLFFIWVSRTFTVFAPGCYLVQKRLAHLFLSSLPKSQLTNAILSMQNHIQVVKADDNVTFLYVEFIW